AAGSNVITFLLFSFNFPFFLDGVIFLGISVHIRSNHQITDELLPTINLLIFIKQLPAGRARPEPAHRLPPAAGRRSAGSRIEELLRKHVEANGFFVGHLDWGNATVLLDSCDCINTSRNCTAPDGREVYSTLAELVTVTAVAFSPIMILGVIFSLALLDQIRSSKNDIV
uniref:Uncharacterized protein n=1 Tax=Stegastes partitus TaxID=144197 RepID=A0A3B5AYD9_9TELE